MPLPKGYEVFPAGYDELEAHVASLCACVVFTGNLDADDLGTAAFKRLFHEGRVHLGDDAVSEIRA